MLVELLFKLEGDFIFYLGCGEGGLYENVLKVIEKCNLKFNFKIRCGGFVVLVNIIVVEIKVGVKCVDFFWVVDMGLIGMVIDVGVVKLLLDDFIV